MAKKNKREILSMFSNNLAYFYPDLKNHFMCPTCLKKIPITKADSISEAHIIPKAAGGTLKTLLCRDCNSVFGSKQDKWFGELVRLSQAEKPSIMSTNIKDGYFMIDDIKINGRWEVDSNGNFNFLIYKNRNSPKIGVLLKSKFKSSPPKINLSFPLPLMRNSRFIDVGFLTAGYLMWFGCLGYSWVLQDHLDIIRKQILNPDKTIIEANFIATCNELNCRPWIGFLPINDEVVLTFGVGRHIAIIPPKNRPDFYSTMGTFTLNLKISDIRSIKLRSKPQYGPPAGLMFEDRVLILPDMVHKVADSLFVIHFTRESNEPKILRPISKDEAKDLEKAPNVIKVSVKL